LQVLELISTSLLEIFLMKKTLYNSQTNKKLKG
jgi:hypothetical protein